MNAVKASKWDGRPLRNPYLKTEAACTRCVRCGASGYGQWSGCAVARYYILCGKCDTEANQLFLQWLGHPETKNIMQRYKRRVAREMKRFPFANPAPQTPANAETGGSA